MKTKQCSKCGKVKKLVDFHRQSSVKDGHHSACKECLNDLYRKWYLRNSKEIIVRKKKYHDSHIEQYRLSDKKRRLNNPDKFREKGRRSSAKYYSRNSEKLKVKHKRWKKEHPENCKAWKQKRRSLGEGITGETIKLVYEDNIKRFGTLTCYLCLNPIPFKKDHLEHKTPLSRGGTNEYNNLAVSCQKCNLNKHTKTEKEFSRARSR